MQPELVLASGSPRRKDLLEMMGLSFSVHPSSVTEEVPGDPAPGNWWRSLPLKSAGSGSYKKTGIGDRIGYSRGPGR